MKELIMVFLMSFSLLISPAPGEALAGKSTIKASFLEEVDAYIQPYIDAGGFSGTILAAKAGEILLNKGYGMANYEFNVPNSPGTKFQIASISKTFTAAAIMVLQERGKLDVHDTLDKFIPDYPNGNKITIHHLLTHTSGIPNVNTFPGYEQKSRFPQTPEQIISMFKDKPLGFKPGERYGYSNSNYNLLAYIIEKVSGLDYGKFLHENIFKPLDMGDTRHHGDASVIIKNLAPGYAPYGATGLKRAPFIDWSIKTGNGSLYSTSNDLYKWDRALYTEKIFKKNSLDEMFKNHINGAGYGWFVRKRLNKRVVQYNGRSPGYTSYLERYIDDDACIIILSNNYSPVPHMIVRDLGAILFGEEYKIPEKIKTIKIDPRVLDAYTGRYQFDPNFYRPRAVVNVSREKGDLFFQWSETYISSLRPLSETKFLDRLFWAYIIFQKDTAGEVSGFIWRDTSDYPAKKLKE